MAVPDKAALGLLNGLAKREYYNEDDISDDFLHSELYAEVSEEEFQNILKRFRTILSTLAVSDMSFAQLEAYLTSQMKRRESAENLTPAQVASVTKFWKSHKSRIHDAMINRNTFSAQLNSCNWRIDLKGQERYVQTSNEPCAIVELHTGQSSLHNMIEQRDSSLSSCRNSEDEKLRFEMNFNQVSKLVDSIKEIEGKIASFCQDDQ